MDTTDIRSIIARANELIDAQPDRAKRVEMKKELGDILMPEHPPLNRLIRINEYLRGVRTPSDFARCLKLLEWVNKQRMSRKKRAPAVKLSRAEKLHNADFKK